MSQPYLGTVPKIVPITIKKGPIQAHSCQHLGTEVFR